MEKYNKEELEKLILIDKLAYEEIGRRYGCTGGNIKKVAKKLGIELPQRRKINEKETFGKGISRNEKSICLNCGEEIDAIKKYCTNKCQQEYIRKEYIKSWQIGEVSGETGITWKGISGYIRTYLFEKYDSKCCLCG
ncbi:MAG: hypothetical protein ACOH2V_00655 [Candidatus Saccharimonadaceae bacterium]